VILAQLPRPRKGWKRPSHSLSWLWNLVVLVLFATAAWSDSLVLVSSQAGQGANDSLHWSQLGTDGTILAASFTGKSASGLTVTANLAAPNAVTSVVCAATPCSWTGIGFAAGDTVIWTSDAANGGSGPLTLNFGSGVSGVGAVVQADGPGQFTVQIQAFNGSTSLGTFTSTSNAQGDAIYIGVLDQTGANITSVEFSLTNCTGTCTDFALDTPSLNVPSATSFPLAVTLTGTGSGSVTSAPGGITCPSVCTANFNSGTSVILTATPGSGSTFSGWSGACSGVGACSVSMTAAKSVTATFSFSSTPFQLMVTVAGTGTGTVTSIPAGISCPTTCSANFNGGTSVTLTATPGSGSTFAGWSGACSLAGTCSVSMTAAQSVTATFNTIPPTFPLTVSLVGTGSVTSAPAGITCPSTCSANFNSGALVNLTATPAAGFTFGGWSGVCSGVATCAVSMTAAKSATATFRATTTTTLTLSASQVAVGASVTLTARVTSTPGGGTPTGTMTFNNGSVVLGTAPLDMSGVGAFATNALAQGTYSLTASYGGGTTFSSSTSSAVTLTVRPAVITTLTVSATQVNAGASVTFTAKVGPSSGSGTPTGTVTFNNGSTVLNTATLNNTGMATFTTSSLATGSDSITAVYSGDANFGSSTSSVTNVEVVDFTVAASPSSLSVPVGQIVKTTLTITPEPLNGFNEAVTFACSGLPSGATCSFSPVSVTPNGSAMTTTMAIQTALSARVDRHGLAFPDKPLYALLIPGLVGVIGLAGSKRRPLRGVRLLGLIPFLALSMLWMTACGGGTMNSSPPGNQGTPTGTSTIVVMASTGGSNPLSHQVQVTLAVH
jgi:trimeric autotransporter adhesin